MTETLPVVLGLIVGIFPFLVFAVVIGPSVRTEDAFYLASEDLSKRGLFATLGASWLFLGNVIVANMILGAYFGWTNCWAIATWAFGFWLAGRHASHIRTKYGTLATLHEYLASTYATPAIKYIAAFITAIVALGVISLELIVGMALIVPLSPDLHWLPFAFGAILTLTIAWYCAQGGLTAVVKTDFYQLIGIMAGVFSLLAIAIILLRSPIATKQLSPDLYRPSLAMLAAPGWPLYLGLFFLQVPLLLGDFGTWQRIRATRMMERDRLAPAFTGVAVLNTVLWSIMVFAGMALTTLGDDYSNILQDSPLYPTAGPILQVMQIAGDSNLGIGGVISAVLLFALILGLVCAMMSSADSYLLIALQTLANDFFGIKTAKEPSTSVVDALAQAEDAPYNTNVTIAPSAHDEEAPVLFGRRVAIVLTLVAMGAAVATVLSGINLLSAVFIIFGSQAVLAPLAVFALRDDIDPIEHKLVAGLSAAIAFVVAVSYGIWAVFLSSDEWHIVNGPYLVPVIAVILPTLALGVSALARGGWPGLLGYLKACAGNYSKS